MDFGKGEIYDSYYFAHCCGRPYSRDSVWLENFGSIADRIVLDIQPRTVLDAGCAIGLLVECLRRRGVEAFGVDLSSHAISQVPEEFKPFCYVGSIAESFPGTYDLIVCIEVLEHLSPEDGRRAIANLCKHTRDILFSSTPFDFREATHSNVQPVEAWAELFAQHGFIRDVDFDATFITPWAFRVRKSEEPVARIIREYERRFWALGQANREMRLLAMEMREQLAGPERTPAEQSAIERAREIELAESRRLVTTLTTDSLALKRQMAEAEEAAHQEREALEQSLRVARADAESVGAKLAETESTLRSANETRWIAEAEHASLADRLASSEGNAQILRARLAEFEYRWQDLQLGVGWQALEGLRRLRLRLAPPGSRRDYAVRLVLRGLRLWRREGFLVLVRRVATKIAARARRMGQGTGPVVVGPRGSPATPRSSPMASSSPSFEADSRARSPAGRFPGLAPLPVYRLPGATRRLNLVTDSINSGSLFGGVGTSLILGALLSERWGCSLRIISRLQAPDMRNLRHILEVNDLALPAKVESLFVHPSDLRAEVPVSDGEVFLTTSWWTTWIVRQSISENRIIHLLQEDERGFYPRGDEYLMCNEVLNNPGVQFIVNSKLLYSHLVADGVVGIRDNGMWFEPAFPRALFYYEWERRDAKRNFFFYARPQNSRNLFYLGLEVIEEAISKGIIRPDEWDLYFVGADVPDIQIGGFSPIVVQNARWAEYAALTRKMDLGLSLMHSPHPSYPPLDLAASGAVVVTNRYGLKQDLDRYSRNILCCDLDPGSLVQGCEEGVSLAMDSVRRLKNYQESGILRDWRESFSEVLLRLADRSFDVRA